MAWSEAEWQRQTVLVTGGTGSFGKMFASLMQKEFRPKKLIILSRDELKQHEMRAEFPDGPNSSIRYFIGDVRDRERLYRAFHNVDIVVHAAALKQVPACEYNPFEAVQTNVLGAKNVIDAAIDCGVKKVMSISTDKAVSPVNLYGATKLCAEKLMVDANFYSAGRSKFSCSRYGNVIGSRGSIVPLFLKQRKTGEITVTDPRMTRFWLTLDYGVRFVIRCIEEMGGGEVFVPKIPSMKVVDVATALAPTCKIKEIGIRVGEKLHETLLSEDEARHARELEDCFVLHPARVYETSLFEGEGKPIGNGFCYQSHTNDKWLTAQEFLQLVNQYAKAEAGD